MAGVKSKYSVVKTCSKPTIGTPSPSVNSDSSNTTNQVPVYKIPDRRELDSSTGS